MIMTPTKPWSDLLLVLWDKKRKKYIIYLKDLRLNKFGF